MKKLIIILLIISTLTDIYSCGHTIQVFSMTVKNKRGTQRIDSLNLISYVVFDEDDNAIRQGMGRTLNISKTGICLDTYKALSRRQKVSLTIGLKDDLVSIIGKVVHVRKRKNGRFDNGIDFIKVDQTHQSVLNDFLTTYYRIKPTG
jgi:hypothetical protein